MQGTNVKLSPEELRLVTDAEIILTKNRIIEKVQFFFGHLSDVAKVEFESLLPRKVAAVSAKIYRGEQYQKLPYVLMDYPRYFKKNEIFAVRNLFWWGKFFSITVHVSGDYKIFVKQAIRAGDFNEWLLYSGEDEWDHSLRETASLNKEESQLHRLRDKSFIKVSKKIPLMEWDSSSKFFINAYKEIAMAIRHQLPSL